MQTPRSRRVLVVASCQLQKQLTWLCRVPAVLLYAQIPTCQLQSCWGVVSDRCRASHASLTCVLPTGPSVSPEIYWTPTIAIETFICRKFSSDHFSTRPKDALKRTSVHLPPPLTASSFPPQCIWPPSLHLAPSQYLSLPSGIWTTLPVTMLFLPQKYVIKNKTGASVFSVTRTVCLMCPAFNSMWIIQVTVFLTLGKTSTFLRTLITIINYWYSTLTLIAIINYWYSTMILITIINFWYSTFPCGSWNIRVKISVIFFNSKRL